MKVVVFRWLAALWALSLPALAQAPAWTVPEVRQALASRYHVPGGGFSPNGLRLSELLNTERRSFSQACITARFYDYRGLSRYRSHAGLHLGYDIAMPYGASVLAGWTGQVVDIIPWYGAEYGVTVRHPDGSQITYGHVAPAVKVGQQVQAGEKVASILIDHVDVKMRDPKGAPFDFGASDLPAPEPTPAALSKDELLARWVVYRGEWLNSSQELKASSLALVSPEVRQASVVRRLHELELKNQEMPAYLEDGLVSQRDVEKVKADLAAARREARMLSSRSGDGKQRVVEKGQALDAAARRLLQAKRQATAAGLSWDDARQLADRLAAGDARLQKAVSLAPVVSEDLGEAELATQVKQGQERLQQLESLYEIGGIARVNLEEARADQKLLEEELRLLRSLVGPRS